jgi:hypothetical protein
VTLTRSVACSALWLSLATVSCGGGSPPPQDPASAAAAAPTTAPPPASADPASSAAPASDVTSATQIPTACVDPSTPICAPAGAFVDRLCTRPHQEVALALFAKATPFTRMYLRGKLDELTTDEEVIALRFHGVPKNGIVVGSGAGSYDVLRWDGSCSMAVEAELFTKSAPSKPRTAHVQWHRLGDKTQTALIAQSDAVKRAHAKRGKECKGAMTGDVSAACEKADAELVLAIVDYVRTGGSLPPADPP